MITSSISQPRRFSKRWKKIHQKVMKMPLLAAMKTIWERKLAR